MKTGLTSPHFNVSGNIFIPIVQFIRCDIGCANSICAMRNNFAGMLSYPVDFRVFNNFIFFWDIRGGHAMKFKRSVCIAVGIPNLNYTQVILISSNGFAGRKILIGEANIRGKTWEIVIKNLRNFSGINNGVVIFTQDNIVSVLKFLVREDRRDSLPERLILFSTFVVKVFRHGFLSGSDNFVTLTPIFTAEFGPKFAKFISGHISTINNLQ